MRKGAGVASIQEALGPITYSTYPRARMLQFGGKAYLFSRSTRQLRFHLELKATASPYLKPDPS